MNSLKSILQNYCSPLPRLNYPLLDSITTNLQTARPNQIVFYRIKNGQNSESIFKKRHQRGRAGLIIINQGLKDHPLPSHTVIIEEPFFQKSQKELVELLFPLNTNIPLIGITGTNGKTSTVWLLGQILKQYGIKGLMLGTMGLLDQKGRQLENLGITTPHFIDLRRILYQHQKNIDFLALEVSSHGLKQGRIENTTLAGAGWTNFSQDHLNYHSSMEDYFKTKSLLKNHLKQRDDTIFIPNTQKNLAALLKKHKIAYSQTEKYEKLPFKGHNLFFDIEYNRENLCLAYCLGKKVFPQIENIYLEKLERPQGRFEIIKQHGRLFVVDYAHTPDAWKSCF